MLRMELPNDIRCVADTAAFVSNLSAQFGVAKDKISAVCFMVETALEMRVKELTEQNATVAVELEERASEFVIRITDKGLPYVLSPYQKEVFQKSNLGRLLFEQLGVDGQRLTLFIKQDKGYVMPEAPAIYEEVLEDTEITCRRTQPTPEDIIEAIRCLYGVYRYEYIHQELYHTDQFEKLLKSGKYVSILAENAHHQVLGYMALQEHDWFPGLREACNLVVKPMARGLGLSKVLNRELLSVAIEEDAGNLYAIPVIHHPVSQKLLNADGFVPCGFFVHMMDMNCFEDHKDDDGKCSAAFSFHKAGRSASHTLYLPEECASFVEDVLNTSGLPYELGVEHDVAQSDAQGVARDASAIMHCIDTIYRCLSIKIDTIGPDLYERLEAWELQNDKTTLDVAIVYLNARDPGAPKCYRYFREKGFVFTGCLPGGSQGDYLLLQHLNGRTFDRDAANLLPNYADMLERLYEINRF